MKKRNLLAVLVLSIVTCGIYILYWLYAVRKELIAKTGNPKDIPYVRILFAPLLLLIPAAILLMMGNNNTALSILGVVLGLASILGVIVVDIFWVYRFCQVTGRVTHKTEGTMLFWLWIVCNLFSIGPVAILIIQNDLNSVSGQDNPSAGVTATPGTPTLTAN